MSPSSSANSSSWPEGATRSCSSPAAMRAAVRRTAPTLRSSSWRKTKVPPMSSSTATMPAAALALATNDSIDSWSRRSCPTTSMPPSGSGRITR
ncbi:hypothetical protein D9M69_585410 [compost metagenome]